MSIFLYYCYNFEKGTVKEVASSKEVLSSSKSFKGKTESEALRESKEFITKLEKEYSDEKYDVDVDVKTNPIYETEPESINVSKAFDSENDALPYVNDLIRFSLRSQHFLAF